MSLTTCRELPPLRFAFFILCKNGTDIGTAPDQWDDKTDGEPDVCAGNFVMNNVIETNVRKEKKDEMGLGDSSQKGAAERK